MSRRWLLLAAVAVGGGVVGVGLVELVRDYRERRRLVHDHSRRISDLSSMVNDLFANKWRQECASDRPAPVIMTDPDLTMWGKRL